MTREWDYADTYVCQCGHICSSYRLGKIHEENCGRCQADMRGEDDEEDDEESD